MNSNDDGVLCVSNCYDGASYLVTQCYDREIITQTISIFTPSSSANHNKKLATIGNVLSAMSTNVKKFNKTLSNEFGHYFEKNHELHSTLKYLDRSNSNNVRVLELCDVKFACVTFDMNWNRSYFPFLGCYSQRGENFQEYCIYRRAKNIIIQFCVMRLLEWEE